MLLSNKVDITPSDIQSTLTGTGTYMHLYVNLHTSMVYISGVRANSYIHQGEVIAIEITIIPQNKDEMAQYNFDTSMMICSDSDEDQTETKSEFQFL